MVTVGAEPSEVVVVAFEAERMENWSERAYLMPTVEFTKRR